MGDRLIFSTIHGSHLYGFDHEGSDEDWYEVYEGKGRKLTQHTDGHYDVVRGDLEAFLIRAASGSHQSAEAIFSQQKDWAPGMEEKWGPLLANFRLAGEAYQKYERTIKKFSHSDEFKRRRHACRLALNLWEMRVSGSGRFNPRIHQVDRALCAGYAATYRGDELLAQLEGLIHPDSGFAISS